MAFKVTGLDEITKGECRQRRESAAGLPVDRSAEDTGNDGLGGYDVSVAYRVLTQSIWKRKDTLLLSLISGHKSTMKYLFCYLAILFNFAMSPSGNNEQKKKNV